MLELLSRAVMCISQVRCPRDPRRHCLVPDSCPAVISLRLYPDCGERRANCPDTLAKDPGAQGFQPFAGLGGIPVFSTGCV